MTGDGWIYKVQLSADERLDNYTVTVCNYEFWQQHIVSYSSVVHTERT
jgi:hypothetical protein